MEIRPVQTMTETSSSDDEMDIQETYRHTPLGHDEVRILVIHNVAGDQIQTFLRHIPLTELCLSRRYYALSYCWGSDDADREIWVDGKICLVTSNLFHAMKAVWRHMLHNGNCVYGIWLDALCINQTSVKEKSIQVQRMRYIYRNAMEVIVWLGNENDGSERALLLLQWMREATRPTYHASASIKRTPTPRERRLQERLSKHYDVCEESLAALLEMVLLTARLESSGALNVQNAVQFAPPHESEAFKTLEQCLPPDHDIWRDCDRLMRRPWFSRIWTFQEITLARQAVVLYGDEIADWEAVRLWRANCFVPFRFWWAYSWVSAPFLRSQSPVQRQWVGSRGQSDIQVSPGLRTLQNLLVQLDQRQAREKHDHVYGLLGLLDEEVRMAIPVDYSLSPAALFILVVRLACSASNGIDFWCHLVEVYQAGPSSDRMPGLPSWCPDLSSRIDYMFSAPVVPAKSFGERVRIGTAAKKSVTFSNDQVISVTGIIVDEIEKCADIAAQDRSQMYNPTMDYIIEQGCTDYHARWFDEMVSLFPRNDPVHQRWLQTYFFSGSDIPLADHKQRFDQMQDFSHLIRGLNAGNYRQFGETLQLSKTDEEGLEQAGLCYFLNNGRFFFRTKAGRIGFAPRPVCPGDRLCFIGGGNYLHVLSSDLTTWITSAELDGLQDDNVLHIIHSQPWRTFELS
ncbi:hypothetical protein LTR27_007297 [Elasticomyces elasticus]|nr:hypothetical protein LTR27_007297 [Elasticomyces elasticus]